MKNNEPIGVIRLAWILIGGKLILKNAILLWNIKHLQYHLQLRKFIG